MTSRQPNKKELEIIINVFGKKAVEGITSILNDVVDLYPYRQWTLPSKFYEQQSFLTIGASVQHENKFYFLSEDCGIYLIHNFIMFPDIERMKKESKKRKYEKSV